MTPPTDDFDVVVTRHMPVPVARVFAAHVRAEHIMRWFGPAGYPVTQCDYDFRVGGRWRMVMTGPDGLDGPPFGGTFLDIVPDRRIVFTNAFEDGGGAMGLSSRGQIVFTMEFVAAGAGTDIYLTLTFASPTMKAEYLGVGMVDGIASSWDQWQDVAGSLPD